MTDPLARLLQIHADVVEALSTSVSHRCRDLLADDTLPRVVCGQHVAAGILCPSCASEHQLRPSHARDGVLWCALCAASPAVDWESAFIDPDPDSGGFFVVDNPTVPTRVKLRTFVMVNILACESCCEIIGTASRRARGDVD